MTGSEGLEGSVVVVTGGAGGIGRGIVEALMKSGALVASLDLAENADASLSVICDLTVPDEVDAAFDRVDADLGQLNRLVCASGIVQEVPFEDLQPPQWSKVLDASLTSAYLACRAAMPRIAQTGGAVVTMSSGWGRKGYARGADYAAAKSGVEALTKSLALEFASRGVRVNSVAPGPIDTAMVRDNPNFDPDRLTHIPMGRIGQVRDVVPPILFLLGEGSGYITGQILHVNGGLLMP